MSLQPVLVPYVQAERKSDIISDPEAFAVFLYHANKFFKPDYSKVVFSGYVEDSRCGLLVYVTKGWKIIRAVSFECMYSGALSIAIDGPVKECLGQDIGGDIEAAWLAANGFPPGHPCKTEIEVSESDIKVTCFPCL